eukprot:gene16304-19392_t
MGSPRRYFFELLQFFVGQEVEKERLAYLSSTEGQEREFQRAIDNKTLGDCLFYFGCRHADRDYLYKQELEQHLSNSTLTKLQVSFSRDSSEPVYVQHLMKNDGDQIWSVMERGGYFYISGSSGKMPKDVRRALIEIIRQHLPTDTAAD